MLVFLILVIAVMAMVRRMFWMPYGGYYRPFGGFGFYHRPPRGPMGGPHDRMGGPRGGMGGGPGGGPRR